MALRCVDKVICLPRRYRHSGLVMCQSTLSLSSMPMSCVSATWPNLRACLLLNRVNDCGCGYRRFKSRSRSFLAASAKSHQLKKTLYLN